MAHPTLSPESIENRIKEFQAWVDNVSGIKRPKEIRLKLADDPNLGFIGVLDLSSHNADPDSDDELEPKAKKQVRPIIQLVHAIS